MPEDLSTGELTLIPLSCHAMTWVRERLHSPITLVAGKGTGPGVTSYSTKESWPCTPLRQHTRTEPVVEVACEPVLRT